MRLDTDQLKAELTYRTSRSSGPGGQNVNKSETRVEAVFDILNSQLLTEEEKTLVLSRLNNRVNSAGELSVAASDSRSQLANKEAATFRLHDLLEKTLKTRKPRKQTKPTKAAIKKRRQSKEARAEVKKGRGWRNSGRDE